MLKQHTVVMLSTNEKAAPIWKSNAGILFNNSKENYDFTTGKHQHLYIIDEYPSIEECENDRLHNTEELVSKNSLMHKIIASTNPSLSLPSPSAAFIEKYCELGGINEVMVEYYEHTITFIDPPEGWKYGFPKVIPNELKDTKDIAIKLGYPRNVADKYGDQFNCRYWNQHTELLKVSSDNTITIKPVKDHYTRAEVFELLEQFALFRDNTFDQIDKNWINSMI